MTHSLDIYKLSLLLEVGQHSICLSGWFSWPLDMRKATSSPSEQQEGMSWLPSDAEGAGQLLQKGQGGSGHNLPTGRDASPLLHPTSQNPTGCWDQSSLCIVSVELRDLWRSGVGWMGETTAGGRDYEGGWIRERKMTGVRMWKCSNSAWWGGRKAVVLKQDMSSCQFTGLRNSSSTSLRWVSWL